MKMTDKLKLIFRLPITKCQQIFYKKLDVLSSYDTIKYILDNNCSVARFGDGELDLMCGIDIKFQKADKKLQQRLKEIAKSKQNNCFICVPNVFGNKKELYGNMVERDAKWWHKFLFLTRGIWYKSFKATKFGDTNISRFYMEVKDKSKIDEYLKILKKIWDGAKIVFVEGAKSRLGVGNDLFDNAKSIKRIICPSSNAFNQYNKIFEKVIEVTNEDDLIICALGPTATVLSYDLSMNNRRALDLGHIDVEYEWYRLGVMQKVSILGKDVSESKNDLRDVDVKVLDDVIETIM